MCSGVSAGPGSIACWSSASHCGPALIVVLFLPYMCESPPLCIFTLLLYEVASLISDTFVTVRDRLEYSD